MTRRTGEKRSDSHASQTAPLLCISFVFVGPYQNIYTHPRHSFKLSFHVTKRKPHKK